MQVHHPFHGFEYWRIRGAKIHTPIRIKQSFCPLAVVVQHDDGRTIRPARRPNGFDDEAGICAAQCALPRFTSQRNAHLELRLCQPAVKLRTEHDQAAGYAQDKKIGGQHQPDPPVNLGSHVAKERRARRGNHGSIYTGRRNRQSAIILRARQSLTPPTTGHRTPCPSTLIHAACCNDPIPIPARPAARHAA